MAASLSDRQQFAVGALAGATAAALATYYYCSRPQLPSITQLPQQQQQQQQHGQPSEQHHASLSEFDQDEVLNEQLTRNTQFFGLDKQKQITNAFVVVIGLGVRPAKRLRQQVADCSSGGSCRGSTTELC